jgi:phasin
METVMASKQGSTTGNTKAIDVPEHVRQAAGTSIAQAKQAVDQCLRQATNLQEKVETSAQSVQAGARAMNQTVLAAAEANINASFDFAQQLVRAKDPQEIVTLQQRFLQQQLERLQDQIKQIGSTASRTVEETGAGDHPRG